VIYPDASLMLHDRRIVPPLLLAPMAGITHSAFRRLVARFGGYGALTTEMLPTQTLLSENMTASPLTKRRSEEGTVFYQLVITGKAPFADALKRLLDHKPFGIDINLGCPAPMISRKGGGKALFDDMVRLHEVLDTIRSAWSGPLSVKCRLGHDTKDWQEQFLQRVELFTAFEIDALCVHPRFFHEKLKRRARWELFSWVKSHWNGILIGNGDMTDRTALQLLAPGSCDGLMIGRAAVTRPWIFQELCGITVTVDYRQVWDDFYRYTLEDFSHERAIGKIKEFTVYYAANFMFGHELFRRVQSAPNLETVYERAHDFFKKGPQVVGGNRQR